MSNKLINQLLTLLDYNNCHCIIFVDGDGFYPFKTLQNFITLVQRNECSIPEIDTYMLNSATVQKSLFDDNEDMIFLFLV